MSSELVALVTGGGPASVQDVAEALARRQARNQVPLDQGKLKDRLESGPP
jgi:hypothetical protein